jgi:hypothetical protein
MIVLPTATLAVNERCAFSDGAGNQLLLSGTNVSTLFIVSGVVNGVPPPIAHMLPPTTAEPGTFVGVIMSARACHVSVAML